MNPLTKVKLINQLNEREADLGVNENVSWHTEYKDSAWIFVGGFPYELTEGDIICVFSQYGEVVNLNLVRDKKTGKSKGFCFICYEDQRSTVLAVDNFNGIKIKGRTLRVDHVKDYRPPKDSEDIDDVTKHLREEGCAPKAPESSSSEEDEQYSVPVKKPKKDKKEKKKKKKEKKEKKKAEKEKEKERERGSQAPSSSPPPPRPPPAIRVKEERVDTAYDKYNQRGGAPPGGQQNGQRARENERLRGEEAERRRDEDRRRNHEREVDRNRDREGDRRRETDRERDNERRRETDDRRETDHDRGDRRRETDWDRDDRRRETDRDDRRREMDRDRDSSRRREIERDDRRR